MANLYDSLSGSYLLTRTHCVWSPGVPPVRDLWGLPVIPCARAGSTAPLLTLKGYKLVWAWTAPGEVAAMDLYGDSLIADVEAASWKGRASESPHAALLAKVCPAVTSHGYVLRQCREALKPFAATRCVVMPQVYDANASSNAPKFLRRCVTMYQDMGFPTIVPLLGIAAGLKHLVAWAEECQIMGLNFHLWAYGSLRRANPVSIRHWAKQLGAIQVEYTRKIVGPPGVPPDDKGPQTT